MKQTIFASDLDNTLIFSYKHALDTDLSVEYLDGKPQGYLPPTAPAMLEELMENALFIPVTSRSVEQYLRIQFPLRCRPRYGAGANRGIPVGGGGRGEGGAGENPVVGWCWRPWLSSSRPDGSGWWTSCLCSPPATVPRRL